MRRRIFGFLWLALAVSPLPAGEPIFRETFEAPSALDAWNINGAGQAEVIKEGDSHWLRVHLDAHGDQLATRSLPVEQLRGKLWTLSARVKAQDVVKATEPWHGVKIMWKVTTPRGDEYPGVPELHDTFGEKRVGVDAQIPDDATEVRVFLGLGEARGTTWIDDVEVTLASAPRVRPSPQPTLLPPEKLDRRSELPRLRGVMYGPHGKEKDIRALAEWGGNLIRWQFYDYGGTFPEKRLDLARYDRWLDEIIAEVDRALPLCRELGIRLVIDLHSPPGGMDAGQMAIFKDAACQQKFIEVWDKLARHYRDEPTVWAYDLLNEPAEGLVAPGLMNWRTLAEHVARRIRAVDEKHGIIFEPGPHGGWKNLEYYEPLPLPGIIYSVHVYDPLKFTHQGVFNFAPLGVSYPGEVDGVYWDRDHLRKILEPVRDYQKDYNVPIYVGEFSAARWAPDGSAARYLSDCIAIFEEYGWDWTYHAFREWQGWSLEIGEDFANESPAPTPTERAKLMRKAFEANTTGR